MLANDQRVGELHSTAAADLGLPAGLPVVMSPYDVACTTDAIPPNSFSSGASKQTAEKAPPIAAGEVLRFLLAEPLEHCVNPEAAAGESASLGLLIR